MDYSTLDSIEELTSFLTRQLSKLTDKNTQFYLATKNIIDRLGNINIDNYKIIIEYLKRTGFKDSDDIRIFRYADGRFKFTNKLSTVTYYITHNIRHFFLITKSILDNTIDYLDQSGSGAILPIYFDGTSITYQPDSEYFLYGKKILIITSIYDAVSKLSNYRIESDKIDRLTRLLQSDIDYIINKQNNVVYNINAIVLKTSSTDDIDYLDTMKKLDMIGQPYPKGFLINADNTIDKTLLKLVQNPDYLNLINQLIGVEFREGTSKIYDKLGSIGNDVCQIPNILLHSDSDFNITDEKDSTNQTSIERILNCKKKHAIIGIGLTYADQNHAIVIVLNVITGRGYLFDPSYYSGRLYTPIFEQIIRYMKKKLSTGYTELNIKPISDFGCVYQYSFQSNPNDRYCISWSFYLTILFLLNEDSSSFDQVVNYLYSLGRKELRVVIPRFLMWAFGSQLTETLLESTNIN